MRADPRWSIGARIGLYTGPREANGCRLWTGVLRDGGYAALHVRKRWIKVSRRILGLADGSALHALHSCDVPACVEPSHLRPGTHLDNMRDAQARRRNPVWTKTACPLGHPYDGVASGRRYCKECDNARKRLKRALNPKPRPDRRGELCPVSKLTGTDVASIRVLLAEGQLSQREIGEQFGVAQMTISHIARGTTWKDR